MMAGCLCSHVSFVVPINIAHFMTYKTMALNQIELETDLTFQTNIDLILILPDTSTSLQNI